MLFSIANLQRPERPDFRAQLMAERLVTRRASPHALPNLWVAMFRPLDPLPDAELVLAIHHQTKSVRELPNGDWFTAQEVHGYPEERGWTAYRNLTGNRLNGAAIGPSQFVHEG